MMQSRQIAFTLLVVSSLVTWIDADKDSNPYPGGSNPNNKNKMYWRDAPNVLEDLDKFSALYIKVHGCVWSEYGVGVNYDDDGENHDGDGNWYMSRVQSFRANAAFSLYGTLRSDSAFSGGGCKRKTYINSFFTYLGADSIVKMFNLGVSAFPNAAYGSNYCYEYSEYSNRDLKSGSGDNNNKYNDQMSTTMGCAYDNSFAIAKFQGDECDGLYFLNITDNLRKYNRAIKSVSCNQVWNYNRQYSGSSRGLGQNLNDDQFNGTYGSIAEKLLLSSYACDLNLYPEACPDPYGLKAKYANNMNSVTGKKAAARFASNNGEPENWEMPVLFLSWVLFVIGLFLALHVYEIKNRKFIEQEGGGAKGFAKTAWGDLKRAAVNGTVRALSSDGDASRSAKKPRKKKKSSRTSKSGSEMRKKKEVEGKQKSNNEGSSDFVVLPDDHDEDAFVEPSDARSSKKKFSFVQPFRKPHPVDRFRVNGRDDNSEMELV